MNPVTHLVNWPWYYVAMYFYISGVCAGAYFIGSFVEVFGGEKRHEISRIAFSLALPPVLLAPLLLILDLGWSRRFWHLFLYAKDGIPYINLLSPMSIGSWGLLAFIAFALLSFLNNLAVNGHVRFAPFAKLYNHLPRRTYGIMGLLVALFMAGYPGVLLNATAWPLWASTSPLLGPLFIASGASTGAAAIALIMSLQKMTSGDAFAGMQRFENLSMLIQLMIIGLIIVLAGQYAAPILKGFYGVMFWGGAVILGTLVPLGLSLPVGRHGKGNNRLVMLAAVLVLFGGAFLRISLMQSG